MTNPVTWEAVSAAKKLARTATTNPKGVRPKRGVGG
jgi:hypothetical protein